MQDAGARCQQYYQDQYQKYLQRRAPGEALNECLHDFLDQRPSGKYTSRTRAVGLAAALFWQETGAVGEAELVSLAIGRILYFDDVLSFDLLDHLAAYHADKLRWAIRFSKLFTRLESPLWAHLRATQTCSRWQEFFGVCDRLLQQLAPYDQLIEKAEHELSTLSLLELLSYLSVLAYRCRDEGSDPGGKDWDVYEHIIQRKLQRCSDADFKLTEKALGSSLKRHLSPLLFPQGGQAVSFANLEGTWTLIEAVRERMDYEASIDWFCFDSECDFQLKAWKPVTFNTTDEGNLSWKITEQKSQLLWAYWLRRGIEAFAASGIAGKIIGQPENHEANQLAYIKATRSSLYLKTILGLGDQVRLDGRSEVALHDVLLAAELSSSFFEQHFLQAYDRHLQGSGCSLEALGRLALEGMFKGENRFPMTWSEQPAKVERIRAWTTSDRYPRGDAEAAKAILQFWTSDLHTLSQQIKNAPNVPAPRLTERPFYKIGRYSFQFPWVVGRQNNLTAAANNLRRVDSRRPALRSETERVEYELASALKSRGFQVVVGYQPQVASDGDAGEIDVLAHQEGKLLLLEVKSGFIRCSRHEVWLHRTNSLRKAARQLKRKRTAVLDALQRDEALQVRLGIDPRAPSPHLHAWVIDTSIEFDGERVDGFLMVSREVIEVALRDEKHYLKAFADELEVTETSVYPAGFSAAEFVRVVEQQEVWLGLL